MSNEPRPEDNENWLECGRCYQIIPLYEGLKQETVSNAIETIDSPFENKTIIDYLPNRTGKKGKTRGKRKKVLHDDSEINDLLRIYGAGMKVVFDSSPQMGGSRLSTKTVRTVGIESLRTA